MTGITLSTDKQDLRRKLRAARREHVAALPDMVRALVFSRPPAAVLDLVPQGATVGLYSATGSEAPSLAYARWFHENGHPLALPWFADRDAPMQFRHWPDPWNDDALEPGPFGMMQPSGSSEVAPPDVLFVPLLGFTVQGDRLGQGGGHYDRWLAAHPDVAAIGLAWDCQKVDALPREAHDRRVAMVITPTRIHQGGA
jgi:5-formyltetrahydrofolate cyclo-ligase